MIELLVSLFIFSLLASTFVSSVGRIRNPLQEATSSSLGFLKQARARALETTSAYQVYPVSTTQLGARYAAQCASEDWIVDPSLQLELSDTVSLAETGWEVCFTSRGLASGANTFTLQNSEGDQEFIDIFLGGAVRQQP